MVNGGLQREWQPGGVAVSNSDGGRQRTEPRLSEGVTVVLVSVVSGMILSRQTTTKTLYYVGRIWDDECSCAGESMPCMYFCNYSPPRN